ncbi:MAG: DUF4982 domain-containing protein [Muribaculaceae bacterium]|nr:DUF4982 domain-containing protein [Muribaculaceae bacterium]
MKKIFFIAAVSLMSAVSSLWAAPREKYNFNSDWLLKVGDIKGAELKAHDDKEWKSVTLPRAFNEDEAFKVPIAQLTDTVVWYRKHFKMPKEAKGQKVFVEFEGVRMGADFYLNGHPLGYHENGVMAVGFDLTPYINYGGDNVLSVRVDNSWTYRERETNQRYQWNDKNFNANYGGIPKNVWLHTTDHVYQTLPLYSNLGTTGTYIYATDIDVASRKAVINAESEVKNESKKPVKVGYEVEVIDADGKTVGNFNSAPVKVMPGETVTLSASDTLTDLNFWSWGYGYLYDVKTRLTVDGKTADEVTTRTGFRKTRFGDGKIWLNDRVLQMKGYAQRTSNEWPGVGMSVPPWMSDYSNGMLIDHNANFFRWMHVTAWKQDAESCDRVGVMQMLPAGDSEKDVNDRRWGQRKELMRDMIIYFRNHPSVIFYESGNESISRDHMLEMREIRDQYDPHGGRAIGSREMLDIREAEYGGEMLYVNLSEHHPMVQTEYCRDEGLRKYWDDWSYPYHKHGDGPLYRNADASAYNQNQDQLAVEMIRRWYDFYRERPGMGRRVNSGGAKIIFSDTQTHCRGAENYRRSGVVDPLRIPKDAYYAHKVMWDGWVDVEGDDTYIIGHWNYAPEVIKPVYVVSTGDSVALFVNGKLQGAPKRDYEFLFTFDSIRWEPGKIEAISYDKDGKETSRFSHTTAGEPKNLKLTLMQGPEGTYADGADIAILQVEVVDENGQRCPLANDMIDFSLYGPAEWRGGIAQGDDNYAFATSLPVECGITRVLVRSTPESGNVKVTAKAKGLGEESVEFTTIPVEVKDGLSKHFPSQALKPRYDRGATPSTPSYYDKKIDVRVKSATAGVNQESVGNSWDDNELSEWRNDGRLETAWIKYELERAAEIDEINIKLTGWRQRSYPLEIFAGDEMIWSGDTDRSLGYVHLKTRPVRARDITIRLKGSTADSDAFGQIVEVVEPAAGELDLFKAKDGDKTGGELRIVEVNFLENLNK